MIIPIGRFKLESSENRWHVIETKIVQVTDNETKQKTGETREKEEYACFDMQFDNALEYIIGRNVNEQDKTVSLPEYIKLYKVERLKLTEVLK